ncbi:MAG: hypothetical protein ACJ72H_24015 [Candidatus Sulfotelmatobacter sp.]
MTRINLSNTRENSFLTWGKNASALVFAAVLIICSIAVGCSSDKPKPITINNPVPAAEPQAQPMPTMPVAQAENKPAAKKPVVRKRPATVNYADKTYGVTFEYPRRYAIETGDAATQLILSNAIPMNFVQPGGIALAAVELPETNYVNTDFSSAFFNVSVHKSLTENECGQFAVPAQKSTAKSDAAPITELKPETATTSSAKLDDVKKDGAQELTAKLDPATPSSTEPTAKTLDANQLLIGDMQLRATEAVSGEGTRQSDSKYFHLYQNGACYEFALNVTTNASEEGLVKHVDRDRVFSRLEQILHTVKINPVQPEVQAESTPTATPAQ